MDASEELYRHQCEVREWLKRGSERDSEWLKNMIKDIAKKRGKVAAERLWNDIKEQWHRGNRGSFGDWR